MVGKFPLEEKDQIIRARYPVEGTGLCGELGLTSRQLIKRASTLGVKFLITKKQNEVIKQRYPLEGVSLCEELGMSIERLRARASWLGVKRILGFHSRGWWEQENRTQVLLDVYPESGPDVVADLLGVSKDVVIAEAKRLKVRHKNKGKVGALTRSKNKKNVDLDYFRHDISDEMAYILGYIFADGCVFRARNSNSVNRLQFGCHYKDKDILVSVLHALKFTGEIKFQPPYVDRKGRKKGNQWRATICNQVFVEPLVTRFGVIPRKSYCDCSFPDYLPEDKWRHFCRGFLDGDGGFSHGKWRSLDTGYVIYWGGTKLFIEGLRDLLVKLLGVRKCPLYLPGQSQTGLHRNVSWQTSLDFLTIGEFLYPEGNDYLYGERKRVYFERARELILYGLPLSNGV